MTMRMKDDRYGRIIIKTVVGSRDCYEIRDPRDPQFSAKIRVPTGRGLDQVYDTIEALAPSWWAQERQ